MKTIFTILFLFLFTAFLTAQDKVLELYTNGAPIDNGLSGTERDEGNNRVSNISVTKMYVYLHEKRKCT